MKNSSKTEDFKNQENENNEEIYPEFNQEEYDKIFIEMAKDREKIEKDLEFLSYRNFPAGIKKQIKSYVAVLIVLSIAFGYLTYISIKGGVGFYWSSLIFYIAVLFYLIFKIRVLFIITEIKDFVAFSGVVINVEKKGLLQNKYYMVKITDGDKILNFKYTGDKKIEKGLPVTLYISETANIRSTEEGFVVDHLLGIEFSDIVEIDDEIKDENIKAKDFFN